MRVMSLQLRLAIRLALLFVAATTIIVGVFVYQSYEGYESNAASSKVSEIYEGAFIDSLLTEFFSDVGWIILVLVLITITLGVLVVRNGLKPIRKVSRIAALIGPNNISVRLPQEEMPSEIVPLVIAINYALDRLEKGFLVQKQFTANAAHELRTPLAIITSALETATTLDELEKIKNDVDRMNRLVEQLLRVARLDDAGLNVSIPVDLNLIAENIVALIAPRAIETTIQLSLSAPTSSVIVNGNPSAIEDALRNLIDNAITYSPPHGEVIVEVTHDCIINVIDKGSGVAAQDKANIFERFARGSNPKPGGVGLGLSIVHNIMKLHGGSVELKDNPKGGAVFSLRFISSNPVQPAPSNQC